MNDYTLNLLALSIAIFGQAVACGLSAELALLKSLPGSTRRLWALVAAGAGLLALQHGYTLELAWRIGLFDLRQGLFAAASAALMGLAVFGFRRQT
jgi:hypothetical protein